MDLRDPHRGGGSLTNGPNIAAAVGPDGRVHVVFGVTPQTDTALHYMVRGDNGGWTQEIIDEHGDMGASSPSLQVDTQGKIHVAYADNSYEPSTLRYATRTASGWEVTIVDEERAVFPVSGDSLGVDPQGKVYLTYHLYNPPGDLPWGVKVATNRSGAWETTMVVPKSRPPMRPDPSRWTPRAGFTSSSPVGWIPPTTLTPSSIFLFVLDPLLPLRLPGVIWAAGV